MVIQVFPQVDPKINFFKGICLNFLQNKNINKKLTHIIYARVEKLTRGSFWHSETWSAMDFQLEATLRPSNDVFCGLKFW